MHERCSVHAMEIGKKAGFCHMCYDVAHDEKNELLLSCRNA